MFNYIITIHNSEKHLKLVLQAVMKIKSPNSRVFAVLDGCTDKSKKIAESFPINIIETGDIRELLSINTALKQAPQDGYNIILQDDVVLLDPKMEEKIIDLYKKFPDLGVVSFRHGANFERDAMTSEKHTPETEVIQNIWQPPLKNVPQMQEGFAAWRQIVYKSPICLSSEVVKKLGGYDERFAPVAHEDTEYCIRAHKAGLRNIVVALKLKQPEEWAGSRRHIGKRPNFSKLHQEHIDLLRKLYPEDIECLSANHPPLEPIKIWEPVESPDYKMRFLCIGLKYKLAQKWESFKRRKK